MVGTFPESNKLVSMGWQKTQVINNKLEVFNVLRLCEDCIEEAVLNENGLDGSKAKECINKISECLRRLKLNN